MAYLKPIREKKKSVDWDYDWVAKWLAGGFPEDLLPDLPEVGENGSRQAIKVGPLRWWVTVGAFFTLHLASCPDFRRI